MPMPSHVVLYVDNLAASTAFYTEVLGEEPASATPSFVLFQQDGLQLGLWAREHVDPAATIAGGGAELVVMLENDEAVDDLHHELAHRGHCIIQPPEDQEFGRSIVMLDPDGHRIRFMVPC